MQDNVIKVGFCVAYDYRLLLNSIPPIYEHADLICLSIDKNRRSWGGNPYDFDEEQFKSMIQKLDPLNKIRLHEGNFSSKDLDSRANCNLQRNEMAEVMEKRGWHIQVDSDEYFINFKAFVNYLKQIEHYPDGSKKPVNVLVNMLPIYKKTGNNYFLVDFKKTLPETLPLATNFPEYTRARNSGHFNHLSPFFALHETWARGKEELEYKIANWGHAAEELADPGKRRTLVESWEDLDESNYQEYQNFHPTKPSTWPALKLIEANSIEELIDKASLVSLPINNLNRWFRNQRFIGKIRQITNI